MNIDNLGRFDPVEIDDVIVKKETAKALLCVDSEGEEFWIPKSQINPESEVWDATSGKSPGVLIIPRWLAEEKGYV